MGGLGAGLAGPADAGGLGGSIGAASRRHRKPQPVLADGAAEPSGNWASRKWRKAPWGGVTLGNTVRVAFGTLDSLGSKF